MYCICHWTILVSSYDIYCMHSRGRTAGQSELFRPIYLCESSQNTAIIAKTLRG